MIPIEVVTLATLAVGACLAIAMLVRLRRMPFSYYLLGIRIMVALDLPLIFSIYIGWFVYPTGHANTVLRNFAFLVTQILGILLSLAQLELLGIISPFVKGIRKQHIVIAQGVVCVFALGMLSATCTLFFTDSIIPSYKILLFVWHCFVGACDTSIQLFLLYFVLYKLKDVSTGLRIWYASLIGAHVVILITGGTHFALVMSFEYRPLAFGASMMAIYVTIAAECVIILRTALLSPKKVAEKLKVPDNTPLATTKGATDTTLVPAPAPAPTRLGTLSVLEK
ncbi:hypothetical protein BC831DRAFT_445397 [Entophlyctis helioformis]|nr:hypothetical protein BC831DRAFT_445397 [Entophlyctis helioformis]